MRWVLHRGALGDSVLLWPRLRTWKRDGVVLVTDRGKGTLAARELGIRAIDIEGGRWNALWRDGAAVEPVDGVSDVVDFVGGSEAYRRNLGAMFPASRIAHEEPPRGGREGAAWVAAHPGAGVAARENPRGPIVVHVGAGSRAKRWPMACWTELARRMPLRVIAGEVEREQFDPGERGAFGAAGGEYLDDAGVLADVLASARVVVACDSGPAHLSAQLGVRTLALFGPTEPEHWAPVGPGVDVLAPPSPRAMDWLGVGTVAERLDQLVRSPMK